MSKRAVLTTGKIFAPFKDWPITGKLLSVVLVPLVLTLGITLALTFTGLNRLEAEAGTEDLQQEVVVISQQFAEVEANLVLNTSELTVNPVMLNTIQQDDRQALQSFLLSTRLRSGLSYLEVIDAKGQTLAVSRSFDLGETPPELKKLHSFGLLDITDATQLVPTPSGWLITAVRSIKLPSGQILGALSAGRLLDSSALSSLNFGRANPILMVFSAEGNLINTSETETQDSLAEAFEVDRGLWTAAANGERLLGQSRIRGEMHRVAYAPLVVRGKTAAVFGVALSTAQMIELRDQLAVVNLTIAGVLGLLTILAALFLGRNYIIRPVLALASGAERFAAGQLEVVVEDITSRDEIGFLAATFNKMTTQLRQTLFGLETRTHSLEVMATLSERLNAILDLNDLLREVVDQVKQNFGYYHTQIYLLDDSHKNLVVVASAGSAGKEMIARGDRVSVDASASLIAQAARSKTIIQVDNVQEAEEWRPDPLLPQTRAEMAVPIIQEGRVLGVLDVQADQVAALDESDANLLRSLANQVAVALTNARLFEQITCSKEEAEQARQEIEAANQSLAAQIWQTTGQARLNERMHGEQDILTLAGNIIQQLCHYLDVQVGGLYLLEDQLLSLAGSYAYSQAPPHFRLGESLVGQAALEKQPIVLSNIPGDYISVKSCLGETLPRHIMIVPFAYNGRVVGVVELGTLTDFSPAQSEFLHQALESIAIAFTTAQARQRVNELLEETQQQAEELQAQEEELRATNEELESQAENLRASEARLKTKQAELEEVNTELEEKAEALQKNSSMLQEQQAVLDQQNRELKAAGEELVAKAEEVALASKYKSQFLANMSHELRTPLNSLLILAGMLAKNEDGNLTPEQVESAQIIHSGGADLLNLINEILDLSKVEAGKMVFHFAPVTPERLLASMQAQFAPIAETRGLTFDTDLAADLPATFETDQQRVEQVVKNLLSNAFKFTEHGSVRLTIARPKPEVDLSHSGLAPDRAIAISVSDTGIGMTPEQQKVVFEAFQQADGSTSRQYGGTGLGLTISRELASKLGGEIGLVSEPGQGSTFTLYLPVDRPDSQVSEPQPAAANDHKPQPVLVQPAIAANGRPKSQPAQSRPSLPDDRDSLAPNDRVLLVIEDDPRFAQVTYDFAHQKQFKCLLAPDGESGLQLAQSFPIHGIILDLSLPGISGWEVLDTLKHKPQTRHIPVHIISAADEDLDAFKRGAIGFLTKPVSPDDLDTSFQKIEDFIERKIKNLLLVEDDPNLRTSVRKLLEGNDVTITEAGLGQAALDHLANQQFDCMILDLSLPDMSGFDLLNRLDVDDTLAKCPVIVYTGKALTEDENRELLKYADSVIVKGVKSPERLLDETALFLHRVIANLPEDRQKTIRQLHDNEATLNGKEVLIVDDDARNAFALSRLLSRKGLKVYIAPTGPKALELLNKSHIDLVLMDIMMPGMDGYETTRRIREQPRFRHLPVLALTAKAMQGDREKCLAAGANDYLAKPVNPDRLFSMLRVWLSHQ